MKSVSLFNRSFNPLGAARRHHKKRNGRLLVAGSGRVIAKGKLGVELPTVDGDIVTYVASPDMVWRFTLDTSARPKVVNRFVAPATPADRVKRAIDTALTELVDLERRASQQGALK